MGKLRRREGKNPPSLKTMIMQLNNAITLSTLEMLSMWSVITSNAWMSIKQSIPRGSDHHIIPSSPHYLSERCVKSP